MSWEGVRCQLCALQLVARTPSGSGPHPAGSPAKSHRFPSREARGDLLWAGPPPEGLRWPCSVDGPGTCSLQRSSRREPALHVGSGQSEFFTHGHKSALRRQRRGWEGPVSPLLTLSSRGGHRTWSFCPRTLSGSPRRSAPAPGGSPGGGACPTAGCRQVGPGSAWHHPVPRICTRHQQRGPQRLRTAHQAPPADRNRQNPAAPPRGGRKGTGRMLSMGELWRRRPLPDPRPQPNPCSVASEPYRHPTAARRHPGNRNTCGYKTGHQQIKLPARGAAPS